jgi:hypothetical protein
MGVASQFKGQVPFSGECIRPRVFLPGVIGTGIGRTAVGDSAEPVRWRMDAQAECIEVIALKCDLKSKCSVIGTEYPTLGFR